MPHWEHFSTLSVRQRASMMAIAAEFEISHGRDVIDENRRREIQSGVAGNYWLGTDDAGAVISFGVAVEDRHGVSIEIVGGAFDSDLHAHIAATAPGSVQWWIRGAQIPDTHHEVLRRLRYMETDNTHVAIPETTYSLRTFKPGIDDEAWLAVNNRAFSDHPEQGAWNQDVLSLRLNDHWFDPSGFLLLWDNNHIAASCWTKIHELPDARIGEIYVIFVNPDYQGGGIGRLMLNCGLDSIHSRGVQRASLFVEDSNAAAIRLYENLGFVTKRIDCLISVTQ